MIEAPTTVKPNHLREYLTMTMKLWGNHVAGPILAVIAIISVIVSASYWNDPSILAKAARWSAWLTGSAAVGVIFVAQYDAWRDTKEKLEAEEQRHIGSDIQGKILFGYLETRTAHLSPKHEVGIPASAEYVWSDLPDKSCCVCFSIDAVNHNLTPARFRADMTTVDITIGAASFHGKWQHIIAGIAVNDSRRTDKRLQDAFDGWFARGRALEQGEPWWGDLSFLVAPFDRAVLGSSDTVVANVKVVIHDTLGKSHQLQALNLELLIGKLGVMGIDVPI